MCVCSPGRRKRKRGEQQQQQPDQDSGLGSSCSVSLPSRRHESDPASARSGAKKKKPGSWIQCCESGSGLDPDLQHSSNKMLNLSMHNRAVIFYLLTGTVQFVCGMWRTECKINNIHNRPIKIGDNCSIDSLKLPVFIPSVLYVLILCICFFHFSHCTRVSSQFK